MRNVSVHVYIKGEGVVEFGNEFKQYKISANETHGDIRVSRSDEQYYLHMVPHNLLIEVPSAIKKQVTRVTLHANEDDPGLFQTVRRGEYRRGYTHTTVTASRYVESGGECGEFIEVVRSISIEITSRSPKAIMRMYSDVLAQAIKPVREYGKLIQG